MTQVTIIRESDGQELIKFFPPDQVPLAPLLSFTLKQSTACALVINEPIILVVDSYTAPNMNNREIFHAKGYVNDMRGVFGTSLVNVFVFLKEIIYHVLANNHITAYDRAMAIVKQ